jgi:sporulation protein YlmC with PRC-barrel domain
MYKCCGIRFSQLKHKPVLDSEGTKIGKVDDFIIEFSENAVVLKSVVIAGGRIEELMESIGIKPDKDPIFQMDCIGSIDEEVNLNVPADSLKTTLDEGAQGDNEMRLSKFARIPVYDSDGFKIGTVIDIWYDIEGKPWLVLGGGFVEETLEKVGVQPDIDLLVPMAFIENISKKKIELKYTKFQLESNCEDEYEKVKRQVSSSHEPKDPRAETLRLSPRPHRSTV